MIIDLILDRQDTAGIYKITPNKRRMKLEKYTPQDFYHSVANYGEVGFEITEALDNGTENDVKRALARYIIDNEHGLHIIQYILSVKWLDEAKQVKL